MGISYIKIENYKSIKRIYLQMSDITALIGMNGSGKSNIISAIKFFYDNMSTNSTVADNDIFDMHNPYSNQARITVGYDLSGLRKRCYENLKKSSESRYSRFYREVLNLGGAKSLELTLIAIKDKKLVWNRSYENRKLLFNLYPIYLIDTRKINLTDWENLWLQIGDLGKMERKEGKEFTDSLKGDFSQYAKAEKIYKKIEELFEKNNIRIKQASPKQIAAYTANLYFGGKEFEFKDNRLTFFSDGTNSFNYIKIFIQILSILTEMKMKEPLVILDEPEISLHNNYIDHLCEIFFSTSKNVGYILSTHSARLIKNILVNDDPEHKIYHVEYKGAYTCVKKMEMFRDLQKCVAITDQHANAFFAQMIVCVEGRTELELLQNRFLKLVYPILRHIDVMEGMADGVENDIISTEKRRYNTPILYAIDMDKVLTFDVKKGRMCLKRDKFKDKDQYSFTRRRSQTIQARKRIATMTQKCAFRYKMPTFFSSDANLKKLKQLIKKYYLGYGYFVMDTTIEGALITEENLDDFLVFFKKTYVEEDKIDIVDKMEQFTQNCYRKEQLNLYRIYYKGKCDLLMGVKELKKKNPMPTEEALNLYAFLESGREGKTGGWVSRWMEFFICNELEVEPFKKDSYNKVSRMMSTDLGEVIRDEFATKFRELDGLMSEIEKRYEGEINRQAAMS